MILLDIYELFRPTIFPVQLLRVSIGNKFILFGGDKNARNINF